MAFSTLVVWNVIVFALYGIDKAKAKAGAWRIKESTLLSAAFLMGAFGAAAGMAYFRHKTKHQNFKILIPLAIIVNIAVILGGESVASWYIQTFQG